MAIIAQEAVTALTKCRESQKQYNKQTVQQKSERAVTEVLSDFREDLRRWFIQQEMDLFRYRFSDLDPKYKTEFLHRNNLKYDTVRPLFFHRIRHRDREQRLISRVIYFLRSRRE